MKKQYENATKFIAILFFGLLLASCAKKEVSPTTPASVSTIPNSTINNWVYCIMQDGYFWFDQMPTLPSLDVSQSPTDFFAKLVYQPTTTDRFSFITNDIATTTQEFNGVQKLFGINYVIGYIDSLHNNNVALYLDYVIKGSPADLAGLKRGDIVMQINGTQLSASNYQTLLSTSNDTQTYTLGTLIGNSVVADNSKIISMTRTIVTEDPVAYSTIIDKSATNGKKIAYLLYTQFVPGLATGDTLKYDNEMRQIFANFKAQGVNEFVLDLRLNPGGYISSAVTLASLLVKNLSTNNIFYKEQYNTKYQAYFQQQYGVNFFNNYFQNEANNLGNNISRVFVLTSNDTYSASELVINCLRPYMDVYTVGDHTGGKNLFGTLVSDDQNRWNWGMYMMLGQTTNSLGQSNYGNINGIAPSYSVVDNTVPFVPFGNVNEPLLAKALSVMGVTTNTQNARVNLSQTISLFSKQRFSDNLTGKSPKMVKKLPNLKMKIN